MKKKVIIRKIRTINNKKKVEKKVNNDKKVGRRKL